MNRILSVFTGHINCIWKKSKLNAPRKRCMKICYYFRCNSYCPWTPTKCDSILIFTSFYNNVCRDIAYFNTKKCHIFQISNIQKVRNLEQPASRRITNWTKPPCDPVQIIRTKDWYFFKFDYRKNINILLLYNLQVIYFWNGHRERRSSHWHLQLHTRLAERYRWRCAELHSGATMLSSIFSGLQHIE